MTPTSLAECCEIVSGATPRSAVPEFWGGDIDWVTPADLSDLPGAYIHETPRKLTSAGLASCSARVLPAGSVLFSSRAPIGHVAINTAPMATNQGFKSLIPRFGILDAKYLYHWLRFNKSYLQSLGNGATFKEVSKATMSRVEIPLPPLDEQRRIAAILDQADALRAKRHQALAHLDEIAQSIFLDTFGDPSLWPDRWTMGTIGGLAVNVAYGTSAKAGKSGKWPILRMGNVTDDGRIDLRDLKFIDLEDRDVAKYTVKPGDMLFNRTNSKEKVGKSAVVRTNRPLAVAGYLVRVRFEDSATAEFVSAYLRSGHGLAVRQKMAKAAVNQANINATEMRHIRVAHPPAIAKRDFARQVIAIDAQRTAMHRSQVIDEEIFGSLQAHAFRGEL